MLILLWMAGIVSAILFVWDVATRKLSWRTPIHFVFMLLWCGLAILRIQ